jgi:hypothetical protein
MKSKTFYRRAWKIIARLLAGPLFGLILTSCDPYSSLYPTQLAPLTTPESSAIAVVSTKTLSPTARQPSYPIYHVKTTALEVRSAPGETLLNIGYLQRGDQVIVYQTAHLKHEYCSKWAKISPATNPARWVCFEDLSGE